MRIVKLLSVATLAGAAAAQITDKPDPLLEEGSFSQTVFNGEQAPFFAPLVPSAAHTSYLSSNKTDPDPDFPLDLFSATVVELRDGLLNGTFTSVQLTQAYRRRVQKLRWTNAILFENHHALIEAVDADRTLNQARAIAAAAASESKSEQQLLQNLLVDQPLLGIPYMLKGNIAPPPHVAPNTAGSFAMLRTEVKKSANVEHRLRTAGAVLLGIANLDE